MTQQELEALKKLDFNFFSKFGIKEDDFALIENIIDEKVVPNPDEFPDILSAILYTLEECLLLLQNEISGLKSINRDSKLDKLIP